jgi:hypothetical protein
MISVCRTFKCPFFSEGQRAEIGAPIGGYGCQKFGCAAHCLVSQVTEVTATEYELFTPEGKSPNNQTMIILGINHLVLEDKLKYI